MEDQRKSIELWNAWFYLANEPDPDLARLLAVLKSLTTEDGK